MTFFRFTHAVFAVSILLSACATWGNDGADLSLAVSRDQVEALSKLLERGADPNLKDLQRGETPLMEAIRSHAMRSFKVLLDSPKINVEVTANNGDTALMIASYTHNAEAVRALLAHGAEPNRPGWTPLHYAAAVGDVQIVGLLLDKSAYIDAESPNKTTPLMMAARAGHNEVVKALIEAGADVSLQNDRGLSAVDFAREAGHLDTASLIKVMKPAAPELPAANR